MRDLGYAFHFTVTVTTRAPREKEVDGVNHFFVSRDEFFNMVTRNELLEWAQVYGNYYGVPKHQVRDALSRNKHVIIRVDVQGARRVRQLIPEALFIFVKPPSIEVLRQHLIKRGVNSPDDVAQRLAAADLEIAEASGFDHIVLNEEGKLDKTAAEVARILDREAHRDPPRSVTL